MLSRIETTAEPHPTRDCGAKYSKRPITLATSNDSPTRDCGAKYSKRPITAGTEIRPNVELHYLIRELGLV